MDFIFINEFTYRTREKTFLDKNLKKYWKYYCSCTLNAFFVYYGSYLTSISIEYLPAKLFFIFFLFFRAIIDIVHMINSYVYLGALSNYLNTDNDYNSIKNKLSK